jgi:Flp pilus assembly pilin Flp
MKTLATALAKMGRARDGKMSVEHGLIAALLGVVIVSVVTTLSGTIETPRADVPVAGRDAP